MIRVTSLLCVLSLACGGCMTSAPKGPLATNGALTSQPEESPELLQLRNDLKQTLDPLPSVEFEPLAMYALRAKNACEDSDLPSAKTLSRQLGMPFQDWSAELRRGLYPVLLANWAKSRLQQKRRSYLSALVRHPTTHVAGQEIPGRNAAFDDFEQELRRQVDELGLTMEDVERVAYEVMLPGTAPTDRAKQVGVLVHADVVPADEPGWDVPPFAGTIAEDRIIGRGAMDDKGPLVAVLFALSALRDSGLPLRANPVLVIGTSEETHWHGIERLVAQKGLPRAVFVADGGFPAGIGEKGVTTVRVRTQAAPPAPSRPMNTERLRLIHVEGGQVPNQVAATASARLRPHAPSMLAAWQHRLELQAAQYPDIDIEIRADGDDLVVLATGQAAHGASPEKGVNAISHLARFLIERLQFADSPCAQLLWILDRELGVGSDGTGLGITDAHPAFGAATVNLGTIRQAPDESCEAALNIRWPPPRPPEAIVASVRDALQREAKLLPGTAVLELEVSGGGLPPYLADKNSPLVTSLLSAYQHVTGEKAEPLTLSGTTYAKAVPGGGVTFGPGMANQKGSRIHVPNEYLTYSEFDRLVEVYTLALAKLCIE